MPTFAHIFTGSNIFVPIGEPFVLIAGLKNILAIVCSEISPISSPTFGTIFTKIVALYYDLIILAVFVVIADQFSRSSTFTHKKKKIYEVVIALNNLEGA